MDIISLAYYGLICGLLGFSAPVVKKPMLRLILGVFVGLIGAALLPYIRGASGYP